MWIGIGKERKRERMKERKKERKEERKKDCISGMGEQEVEKGGFVKE